MTANGSTWPDVCPTCGADWKVKSRTMGMAYGQPHQGICANNHRWYEGTTPRVDSLIHYTDHHGGTVCGTPHNTGSFIATEVRSKVTCPECAKIKPANQKVDAAATSERLLEARAKRLADLKEAQRLVDQCNCQYPIVVYRNGHGHSPYCLFVLDRYSQD